MKFAFIQAEKASFPVAVLCRVLQVSRQGFYASQRRPEPARQVVDRRLSVEIAAIHAASRRCYGSPRIHAELRASGQCTSRKRVARLMRASGLVARRRRHFRVPKPSTTLATVGNVLDRQFRAPAPNRRWVTDITYLTTVQGWLYLAVVLDLFSRRVVGWATSDRLGEGLALEALTMSLARRRPAGGLVHHSDRGPQYVSDQYSSLLARHGIVMSLSRPGNCWDNAVAESFFATLKVELVYEARWLTRAAAERALFDYIEVFYNGQRRHSSLGYLSPRAFEAQRRPEHAQAV
jgi:transposase InsO family protein